MQGFRWLRRSSIRGSISMIERRMGSRTMTEAERDSRKSRWDMHDRVCSKVVVDQRLLQANWSASPKLVPWIVVSLGVFALGVLKATSIYGQLVESSLAHDVGEPNRGAYARRHRTTANTAWVRFLIGCAI